MMDFKNRPKEWGRLDGFRTCDTRSLEGIVLRPLLMRAVKTENLIKYLNVKIQGWVNYYRHCVAKATFNYLDNSIFWIVWKWAKRRHQNRGASWIRKRYYTTLGLRKWCFYSKVKAGKQESRILLTLAQRTKIERHVKVRSEASPYDPDFKEYFIKRKGEKMRKKNDSWVI